MMARTTINISNATSSKVICQRPDCSTEEKAILATLLSKSSCGVIIGKPIIAIKAACCCALAAMAARKVNVNPNPMPPKQLMPTNCHRL